MTRESVFRSRLLSNNTRKFILFITLVWVILGIISFYQYRHSAKISRHSAKEKEKTYNLIKELNSCKQTVQSLISKTKSCLNQQKSDATKSTQNEEDVIYEDIDDNLESITNNEQQTPSSNNIAVLIFTFQRAEYLKRALDAIFKYIPQYGFDVYVSQDGDHQAVTHTIQSFGSRVHHLKVQIISAITHSFSIQEILKYLKLNVKNVLIQHIMQLHSIMDGHCVKFLKNNR